MVEKKIMDTHVILKTSSRPLPWDTFSFLSDIRCFPQKFVCLYFFFVWGTFLYSLFMKFLHTWLDKKKTFLMSTIPLWGAFKYMLAFGNCSAFPPVSTVFLVVTILGIVFSVSLFKGCSVLTDQTMKSKNKSQ